MTLHPGSLPAAATEGLGGPLGAHVSQRSQAAPARVRWILVATALPMVAAVLRQGSCIENGWVGNGQFWRGCYSGLANTFALNHLNTGLGGWLAGNGIAEPPLIAALMSGIGGFVGDGSWLADSRWYMGIWAVLLTLTLAACVLAVVRLRPGRLDIATQMALTPALITAGLLSVDLVAVALALWAMVAWRARRTVLAGVLLGISLTGHFWAFAVLAGLVFSATRVIADGWDDRSWYDRSRTQLAVAISLVTLALSLAILLIIQPQVVVTPITNWWAAAPGYGSLWMLPQLAGGQPLSPHTVSILASLGVFVALVLGWARSRDRHHATSWPALTAIVLGVIGLTSSAVPIQTGLVLLAFAIVAGIGWRDHLIFVGVEALHGMAVWLFIGYGTNADKGLPGGWYLIAVLIRAAVWVYLIRRVWRLGGERIASLSPQPGKLGESVPTS